MDGMEVDARNGLQQSAEAYNLDGYLCKPFTLVQLVQTIDNVLNKKPS